MLLGTLSARASGCSRRSGSILALAVLLMLLVSNFQPVFSPSGAVAQAVAPETNPLMSCPCWTLTGNLNTAHNNHTATLLPNGKVLVAGGDNTSNYTAITELYNPATGTWSNTGSLNQARNSHTATLLPNGKVLVAGGQYGVSLSSAELYNPATGTWSNTGSLNNPRYAHTATLLANGKVLVTGGFGKVGANFTVLASAELYDPTAGTWSNTGTLNSTRYYHTATLLANGKVLVAGGVDANGIHLTSAELYDPMTGTWSNTGSLNTGRDYHTATLLNNGKVLVAGGLNSSQTTLTSAELYDPTAGTWSNTGNLNSARFLHTATLLNTGQILAVAGLDTGGNSIASAELYDPTAGTWNNTVSLNNARGYHTATLLPNGKVLAVGGGIYTGGQGQTGLKSAELYDTGVSSPSYTYYLPLLANGANTPVGQTTTFVTFQNLSTSTPPTFQFQYYGLNNGTPGNTDSLTVPAKGQKAILPNIGLLTAAVAASSPVTNRSTSSFRKLLARAAVPTTSPA